MALAPRRHTFGFATVMVIVLIGLLAVILSATATRASAELRRTASSTDAAQVSRLLSAAVQSAQAQIREGKPTDGRIDSPLGQITLAWQGDRDRCEATADYRSVKRTILLIFDNAKLRRVDALSE